MNEYVEKQTIINDILNCISDSSPDHFDLDTKEGYGKWMHANGENLSALVIALGVKEAKPADVRENKYGRWIGYPECLKFPNAYADDHIVCSECEECFSVLSNDCERFDFCPHCGTDMRKKNEVRVHR